MIINKPDITTCHDKTASGKPIFEKIEELTEEVKILKKKIKEKELEDEK
jgi:hypothetical protein